VNTREIESNHLIIVANNYYMIYNSHDVVLYVSRVDHIIHVRCATCATDSRSRSVRQSITVGLIKESRLKRIL